MGDSRVIERPSGRETDRHRRGQWLLFAGFVVLAALITLLAYLAWRQQAQAMTEQAERSLNAVAQLKATRIAAWAEERRGDAELMSHDALLSAAIGDLLAGRDAAASAGRIRSSLAQIQRSYRYVDVILVAPGGRPLIRVPASATHPLGPEVRGMIAEAETTGEVVSSDIYLAIDGVARLELVAPVLAQRPGDPPVASVVLHADPKRFLYPFIQDWPLPSDSGETLLVERRGDRVVYLNELRHRKGTALKLSAPASEESLPAAMAARGRSGIVEGEDYRGVPVMAAIAPVPATDWFVVAKVDTSEVLDPIRRRGWMTAGFTLLVVALGAVGSLLLWRLRERQVDAELVASEQTFRYVFDSALLGMSMTSPDGEVHANAAFCSMLGYSTSEIAHKRWQDLTPPEDVSEIQTQLDPLLEGVADSARFLKRYVRKDGGQIWTDVSTRLRRDAEGRPLYFLTAVLDITQRKRAEDELRAGEAKFREVVESLEEGYYSVTVDGVLLDHNPAYCRVLGMDGHTDLRGQRTPDFWWREDDRGIYVRRLQEEGRVRDYLVDAKRIDGARLAVLLNAHAVRGDDGAIERVEGTVLDFTARKAAEDEVVRLNAELEQRVADRTAELDGANKELEAFAYSVSHDLRAPLRHISGFSTLLADRTTKGLDEKSLHYVDVITRSVNEMGVLIDDLLQFSRTGRAELNIEPVDMDVVIQEALAPLRHEVASRELDWSIEPVPQANADRALIRQVWANLLSNAVKYTRPATPTRIKVSARETDGVVVYSVADNGVGFDMQYAHKLFGVFQRLHDASEFEGTGIGLANVHRIVTRLHGRVWAEGELGKGATFSFSLPAVKETK